MIKQKYSDHKNYKLSNIDAVLGVKMCSHIPQIFFKRVFNFCAHIIFCITTYYIILYVAGDFIPVWGSNPGPIGGCVECSSFTWRCRIRAVFVFHHHHHLGSSFKFGPLAPLLAKLFGVRFTSMRTLVCMP